MEAIQLIVVILVLWALWWLFHDRWGNSKRRPKTSRPQRVLQNTKSLEKSHLPVTKPTSKRETWIIGPDAVLKNEYVSYSRVQSFKTCPRKFELIYLYGFEDKSGRAAQVGTLVHEIVHLYTVQHKGRLSDQLRRERAVEELLSFYDQAVSSTDLTYRIPKSELRLYLSNFVILNRTTNPQIQATECECNSMIGVYNLKCIIDRIDEGGESTPAIIDYKTGKPQNVVNDQLNLYAYALSHGKWTPFQVVFQFLKTGEVREWKYTRQLHCATEEWLLEGIEEIENAKVFRRNTSRLCDYCGVSEHCNRVP